MILVFRHVPHEGLGAIAPAFRRKGLGVRCLDVWKPGVRFPTPGGFRGLIVMGGPMGVYEKDRYPFLKKELTAIKAFLAARKPVLGVCLGSQLIAHALGSRVYPNKRKEIGWYDLELTAEGRRDSFFAGFPRRPRVFQWHGDTFDLPRGARLLATAPLCRHQAFRWRDNVYALQFHLEITERMVREWLAQPGVDGELAQVGPGARARLERGVKRNMPALRRLAGSFFRGFASAVAGR